MQHFWIIFIFLFSPLSAYSKPTRTKADSKKFSFRLRDEPETLDWNRAHTLAELTILNNLMEGLVRLDEKNELKPALCLSWEVSSDGLRYTYHLDSSRQWSDGVPLKAQDFVYSWKRLLSPLTAAAYSYLLYDIKNAEAFHSGQVKDFSQVGVQALDEKTLRITLRSSLPSWKYIPSFWATFPLRQDKIEAYGVGWDQPGKMVVLGPYQLVLHDYQSKLVLKPNPTYPKKKERGNLTEITAHVIPNDSEAFSKYEAKGLDVLTDFSNLSLTPIRSRSDFRSYPQLNTTYLGFVTDQYPVSDLHVRRAISYAINRTQLIRALNSDSKEALGFVAPSFSDARTPSVLPHDLTLAKKELSLSSVDVSRGMTLDLLLPSSGQFEKIASFLKEELMNQLGFQVTIQSFENKTYRTQMDLKNTPAFLGTWTADYPDPDSFYSVFLSNSGNNFTSWKNPLYDGWVLKARKLKSDAQKAFYQKLNHLLLQEEAVIIPLFHEPHLALVKKQVKNFQVSSQGLIPLWKIDLKH